MEKVMVKERDKITDRLEGILADIRYLGYDDPTIAVDTLDGCVAQCAEILTRIKRLRRWVRNQEREARFYHFHRKRASRGVGRKGGAGGRGYG